MQQTKGRPAHFPWKTRCYGNPQLSHTQPRRPPPPPPPPESQNLLGEGILPEALGWMARKWELGKGGEGG